MPYIHILHTLYIIHVHSCNAYCTVSNTYLYTCIIIYLYIHVYHNYTLCWCLPGLSGFDITIKGEQEEPLPTPLRYSYYCLAWLGCSLYLWLYFGLIIAALFGESFLGNLIKNQLRSLIRVVFSYFILLLLCIEQTTLYIM